MKGCRGKINTLLTHSFTSCRLHAIMVSFVFCCIENGHCDSVFAIFVSSVNTSVPFFYYSLLLLYNYDQIHCYNLSVNKQKHLIRSFIAKHLIINLFCGHSIWTPCKQTSATFPNVEKALIMVAFWKTVLFFRHFYASYPYGIYFAFQDSPEADQTYRT